MRKTSPFMEQHRKNCAAQRKAVIKLLANPKLKVINIARDVGVSPQRIYQIAKFEGIDVSKFGRKTKRKA